MQVITLLNEKGGVGKTTLATHLAAGLAIKGNRVLLIDADSQAHSTLHLGKPERGGLFNLLIDEASWDSETLEIKASEYAGGNYQVKGELYLMPSTEKNRAIPMVTSEHDLLHERLQELSDLIDVVVIDTPPETSMLQTIVYMASDYVLYPSQPEIFSSDGLTKSIRRVPKINQAKQSMGLGQCRILGIQMTMVEMHTVLHQTMVSGARNAFGDYVWSPIAKRSVWREAQAKRTTLFSYNPTHEATDELWGMVNKTYRIIGA